MEDIAIDGKSKNIYKANPGKFIVGNEFCGYRTYPNTNPGLQFHSGLYKFNNRLQTPLNFIGKKYIKPELSDENVYRHQIPWTLEGSGLKKLNTTPIQKQYNVNCL